jgi:germination protein M
MKVPPLRSGYQLIISLKEHLKRAAEDKYTGCLCQTCSSAVKNGRKELTMKESEIKYKKNKLNIVSLVVFLIIAVLLGGCSSQKKENDKSKTEESKYYVYYIDKNETKIVGEPYKPVATDKEELVKEYFKALSKEPKDISLKSAKPEELEVQKVKFNEDNGLSIDFNSAYSNLEGVSEVLFRACVVKTLCQIDGVNDVEFYVEGQPLTGLNDQPISFMKDTDFIDGTSAENVYVTVYFANEKGNKLVATNLKIPMYDSNGSVEKLILASLIAGPKDIKNINDKVQKTIPDGTKLIDASTKDGICYVNFNEDFLDKLSGIKDDVVIYSVVNSLVELSTINKVQFLINGETKKSYREGVAFDELFERNLDLIEGSK